MQKYYAIIIFWQLVHAQCKFPVNFDVNVRFRECCLRKDTYQPEKKEEQANNSAVTYQSISHIFNFILI